MNNSFYELLATGFLQYPGPRVAANDTPVHRPELRAPVTRAVLVVARWIRTWLITPVVVSQKRYELYEALEAKSDRQLVKAGIERSDLAAIAYNAYGDNCEASVPVATVSTAVVARAANDQLARDGSIAA